VAHAYLRQTAIHREADLEGILAAAETEFATISADEKKHMLEEDISVAGTVWRQLVKFWNEYGLLTWVENQNMEKGIAPITTSVARQWHASSSGSHSKPLGSKKTQRQWLRRWRRRWNVQLGTIAPRETLSPADCHAKASCATLYGFSFTAVSRTDIGMHFPRGRTQVRVHVAALFLGSHQSIFP